MILKTLQAGIATASTISAQMAGASVELVAAGYNQTTADAHGSSSSSQCMVRRI